MEQPAKHYQTTSIGALSGVKRETLHDSLALTGAEISVNQMPPGASIPFVHSHKQNEEIYLIVRGKGFFQVDDEEFEVAEGSAVRIDPAGKRAIKAAPDEGLTYICVQATCGSLIQFTQSDGVVHEEKPVWK